MQSSSTWIYDISLAAALYKAVLIGLAFDTTSHEYK